ncbi:hypothetical protein ES705_35135 [subsurface metagenome]
MPGSPIFHAYVTISLKTSRAFILLTSSFVRGFTSPYSSFLSTACMNSSVTATEVLKLVNSPLSFALINSRMSGCSALNMPMFAPLLFPPCLITSVATSKTRMKETGPEATPPVDLTTSPFGLSREKEKPVPPPLWWIKAVFLTALNMLSIESSTGKTKQAASCPSSVPAFINVGLLGRNSRLRINR